MSGAAGSAVAARFFSLKQGRPRGKLRQSEHLRDTKLHPWSRSTFQQVNPIRLIAKLAVLWIVLLVPPFAERTLLGAKTYYFLYIGLGLVFVLYGLIIRSLFSFLQHARREPVYVLIAYLVWSVFICSILSVFAIEYDLLPQAPEPSITHGRPLIDYLYSVVSG